MISLGVGSPQCYHGPRLFDSYQCVLIASSDGCSQSTLQPEEGRSAKEEELESVPEKHSFLRNLNKYHQYFTGHNCVGFGLQSLW